MKAATLVLAAVPLVWLGAAVMRAEEPRAAVPVQARLHRALADLIEARAAATPDQARIAKLTKEVQELRRQPPGPCAAAQAAAQTACPGCCPCPAARAGFGRGAGWGRGPRGACCAPGGFVDADRDGVCDHYERRHGVTH
jgi:hypothetical protein